MGGRAFLRWLVGYQRGGRREGGGGEALMVINNENEGDLESDQLSLMDGLG